MTKPKATYIVSAYNRPECLPCCLWSLKVQSDPDFEVIVANNAMDWQAQLEHLNVVQSLNDPRFRHVNTAKFSSRSPAWDCYWAAEWIFTHEARGEWICLPSDDSYYVPVFQQAMLEAAAHNRWQFVYSDMLYDRRLSGRYDRLLVEPRRDFIDKTGFLLHRNAWIGFPTKPTETPGPSSCDGEMAAELVRRGVAHGRVPEILVCHN